MINIKNNAYWSINVVGSIMKSFIVYLFFPLFIIGCAGKYELLTQSKRNNPNDYTISTKKIQLKKPVPFNLSEIYLSFVKLNKNNKESYLLNVYYFGQEKSNILTADLIYEDGQKSFTSKIPIKVEEHGPLGFSENIFIEVPYKELKKFAEVGGELTLRGKDFSYNKKFDKKMADLLSFFLKETL